MLGICEDCKESAPVERRETAAALLFYCFY
jgi:hypothetical protein